MQERHPVRPWEIGLVLVVLTVVAGLAAFWVLLDGGPLLEHSGRSIQDSLLLWKRLQGGLGFEADDYPPLASLVSCAFYGLFGPSRLVAVFSQFLFLIPYLVGCWWIGRELGGRGGGALTLLAAGGNPWMSSHLHGYYLEIGTTALVALAFALLLASRGGRQAGPTLALGVVAGLGMLSKWSWLLFVGPGLLWPVGVAWKAGARIRPLLGGSLACLAFTLLMLLASAEEASRGFPWFPFGLCLLAWLLVGALGARAWRRDGWNPAVGTALAWGLAFAVCGWWYFLSIHEVQVKASLDFTRDSAPALFSLGRIVATLASGTFGAGFFFLVGTGVGLRVRGLRIPTLAGLAGILLPTWFYVASKVPPGARYALPATVLVLALSFGWWGRFRKPALLLGALLVGVGWLQIGSWTLAAEGPGSHASPDLTRIGRMVRIAPPPRSGPPVEPTALRLLGELEGTDEREITAILLPGGRLDPDVLILESILRGRELDIRHILPTDSARPIRTSLLLVVGEIPEQAPWLEDFRLLESWEAPDWGAWSLLRKRAPSKPDGSEGGVSGTSQEGPRARPGADRSRLPAGE